MINEENTILCKHCGRKVLLTNDLLARILNNNRINDSSLTEQDFSLLTSMLKCTCCGKKNAEVFLTGSLKEKLFCNSLPAVTCKICNNPIPEERLRAVPGTDMCVNCKDNDEKGLLNKSEPYFCKRCGAKMVWRFTKQVLPTRYFLGCSRFPSCRYTEFK